MTIREQDRLRMKVNVRPLTNSASSRPQAYGSLKSGFSMIPKILPKGSKTVATRIPSPTSFRCAQGNQSFERSMRIRDAPIGDRTAFSARSARRIRVESQFVAAYVEPYVKRLIEVRFDSENLRVPRFGFRQIWRVINDRAQALKL